MKKRLFIFTSPAIIVLAAIFTLSNTIVSPNKLLRDNIEAFADEPWCSWIDDGKEIYFCEERACEVHFGIPPLVVVKYGIWYKCKEGGDHSCGECDKNCDAL